jgi:hypothetical protein
MPYAGVFRPGNALSSCSPSAYPIHPAQTWGWADGTFATDLTSKDA